MICLKNMSLESNVSEVNSTLLMWHSQTWLGKCPNRVIGYLTLFALSDNREWDLFVKNGCDFNFIEAASFILDVPFAERLGKSPTQVLNRKFQMIVGKGFWKLSFWYHWKADVMLDHLEKKKTTHFGLNPP